MTLGRMGGLSQLLNPCTAPRTYQSLMASISPSSQGEVESIFEELCRALDARDSSHATVRLLQHVV